MYFDKPYPQHCLASTVRWIDPHPQFDSADFQGPIARPVSDDFHHFFAQIATEYDADPIPTVAFGRGFTLCAFNALLPLVIFKMIFIVKMILILISLN